jgi:hypothetical protein
MLSSICFMNGFVDAPVLAAGFAHHSHVFRRQHCRDVHSSRVVPDEERLVGLLGVVAVERVDDLGRDFLVHGLGSLQRQRTLVFARLIRLRSVRGRAPDHRARGCHAGRSSRIHSPGDIGKAGNRRVFARRNNTLLGRGLVCGEIQLKLRRGSERGRCSVLASGMSEGLR